MAGVAGGPGAASRHTANLERMSRKGMSAAMALFAVLATLAVVVAGASSAGATTYPCGTSPPSWCAYAGNFNSDTVMPINGVGGSSPAEGTSITTANAPTGIAFTPSGNRAFVANEGANSISVIDTLTGAVTTSFTVTGGPGTGNPPWTTLTTPYDLAVTPDGQELWVANYGSGSVDAICIESGGCTIGGSTYGEYAFIGGYNVGGAAEPVDVAITPNGAYAYVSDFKNSSVYVVDTSSFALVATLAVGASPSWVTFTPDGSYAWVASCGNTSCNGTSEVTEVSSAESGTPAVVATTTLTGQTGAKSVEVLPNCTPTSCNAYVANYASGTLSLVTGADSTLPTFTDSVLSGLSTPASIAVTPNSADLYVTETGSSEAVEIPTSGSSANTVTATFTGLSGPRNIAITPDQAPAAALSVTPAPEGLATLFDASASSAADTITSYAWNFGDGCTETTSTPTVSFAYPSATSTGGACPSGTTGTISAVGTGPFSASVTETDAAGATYAASLTPTIFTGHTASVVDGPQAQATSSVSLPSQLVASCSACSGAASATPDIGPVTLTLENASGTATPLPSGDTLSVDLSSNATELSGNVYNFYAASGGTCSTSSLTSPASITMAGGSSTAQFCYSDETASSSVTLTGAAASPAGGITSATQAVTITAGAPYQVGVATSSLTATASSTPDLGPVGIAIEDQFHNPSPLPSGDSATIALSSSSSGVNEFSAYSAGACSTTTETSAPIAAGADLAQVCYGDELAGSPSLSFVATTTGFSLSITSTAQSETITPGPPVQLAVTSSPLVGGISSTPNLGPIDLAIADAFGNPSPLPSGDSASISLSDGGKGGKFSAYSSGACSATTITAITVTAGTASAPVCYGNAAQGAYALSFSASTTGFTLTTSTATQTETVLAATKVVITTSAFSQAASPATKSKVTATLENASGTPEAVPTGGSVTLSFSSSSAAGAFAASSGASPAPGTYSVTIGAGSSAASAYYGDTVAGNPVITASVSGLTPGTQKETITPGPVDTTTSDAVASPTTQSADGIGAVTVTVSLADQYGNGIAGKAISLTQGSSTSAVITAIDATTNADGLASFSVTDTTAQVVDLTAKDTTDSITISNTTPNPLDVTFTSGLPDVTGVSPSSGSTAGGNVVTITGTNFTGATKVDFGTTAATNFTVVSSTEITATAPAESAGHVDVTVTASVGTSATTSLDGYIYVTSGPYYALSPYRICDTRPGNPSGLSGTNAQCNGLTLQPGGGSSTKGVLTIQVAGTNPSGQTSGGVPSSAVAVVMNVTVIGPSSAAGNLNVWPAGTAKPTASAVNWWTAGQVIPDQVEVALGANGEVSLHNNSAGTVNLIVDVAGYVGAPSGTTGLYNPVSEYRYVDTRCGAGELSVSFCASYNAGAGLPSQNASLTTMSASSTLSALVTGYGGVPKSGVAAVVLRITATNTKAPGDFKAYPAGTPAPTASVVNWATGATTENRATVAVGNCTSVGCYVTFYDNSSGSADIVVDVVGYYSDSSGTITTGAQFNAMSPIRACDTRANNPSGLSGPQAQCSNGTTGSTLQAGLPTANYTCSSTGSSDCEVLQVEGMGGIPTSGVAAVVMNVTVIGPSAAGNLGVSAPFASLASGYVFQMTFPAHAVQNELLIVQPSSSGQVELYNHSSGTLNVTVDLVGWYG